jgi:hypothetical protein
MVVVRGESRQLDARADFELVKQVADVCEKGNYDKL